MNKDELTMQLKEQTTFEPRRRIAVSVDKLSGKNPVLVLHKELGRNRHVANTLQKLKGFLSRAASKGNGEEGDVSIDKKEVLSVGEQVDVLLYLATDENIACRSWQGLALWI